MGFNLLSQLPVSKKWYPDKRRLITGVIVSALWFRRSRVYTVGRVGNKDFGNGVPGQGELTPSAFYHWLFYCGMYGWRMVHQEILKQASMPEGWTPKKTASGSVSMKNIKQALRTPSIYLLTFSLMLACNGGIDDDWLLQSP